MTATTKKTAAKTGKPAPKKPASKKPATPKPAAKKTEPARRTVQKPIPLNRIDPDPNQPRKFFDEDKLQELADSIKKVGVLQPVSVRYNADTRRYTLIMGERRWRASQKAGLTEIPALVEHGLNDREIFARSVAENVGRADMTPLEEAKAFQKLVDHGYSPEEVAKICGKSWNHVDLRLSLLKLVPELQDALEKGHIQVGLAWYATKLSPPNQHAFLIRWSSGAFPTAADAETFVRTCKAEEDRHASQGSMFVLAAEAEQPAASEQDSMFPHLDVPEGERERIAADRQKLVKKIDKLSTAGEILSEIAAMDPAELAILLSGAHGGIPGNRTRITHLKNVAGKAVANIREAQAVAEVRAGALRVAPDAETATGEPAA